MNKERAYFSCFGRGVDLFAPGYKVLSAVTGGNDAYEEYSGTSMATPHVAGVLALMLQHNPDWSVAQQVAELTGDCVETGTLELLDDSLNTIGNRCNAGQTDDRCNVPPERNPNNCHNCTNQDKCWSRYNYEPGSGEGETPCGWYSEMSGECSGVCICYCGGKHCDATYLWGIWLQFCCNTYFASCEPDSVTSSPNKLTNLFGSGRCAAAIASGTSPSPPGPSPPGPVPTPSPVTPAPTPAPTVRPTPAPTPRPTPTPPSPACEPDWLDYCVERHCDPSNGLYEYCKDCPVCAGGPSPGPSPTPRPTPAPTPGNCNAVCDRPSDCTEYPTICSGCEFCDDNPGPVPTPPSPPAPSPGGTCNDLCDRQSDCTNYPSICGGCSWC